MRKLLIGCLLSLVSVAALAKPIPGSLPGFQDVRFGETATTASAKLKKRYKYATTDGDTQIFIGEFGGYRNCQIQLWTKKNAVHMTRVAFFSQDDLSTRDIFFDVFDKLRSKYGKHTGVFFLDSDFNSQELSPEELSKPETDEQVERDTRAGKGWVLVEWRFSDGNTVELKRIKPADSDDLFVAVDYRSTKTLDQIQEKAAKDF